MDIKSAKHIGRDKLSSAGIDEANNECDLILCYVLSKGRGFIVTEGDYVLSMAEEEAFLSFVNRRCTRIPLSQILGVGGFYGRDFIVNKDVLTPRFETELLVEEAEKILRQSDRVLDLCTGSGCIAITMALLGAGEVIGTDISPAALRVAKMNAKKHNANVLFLEGDLFIPVTNSSKFDIIISNPPYIKDGEKESLMPEVRDHEPHLALFAGPEGLDFYRRIAREVRDYLNPGGTLILEIGYDQGPEVSGLMKEAGFSRVLCKKDYAGYDRVIIAR